MLLRVEMKCHYRNVYLTSIGRHSEKKPEETLARMRSKFLKKIAQAAYRRTRRSPFTGDLANIRRFIIYVTSLCLCAAGNKNGCRVWCGKSER